MAKSIVCAVFLGHPVDSGDDKRMHGPRSWLLLHSVNEEWYEAVAVDEKSAMTTVSGRE